MSDLNIQPNLQGYQLDENGEVAFSFAAGRGQFTKDHLPSATESRISSVNGNGSTHETSVGVSFGSPSRSGSGTGMGRGRGRGRGGSTATTSTRGKRQVKFTKKKTNSVRGSESTEPAVSSSDLPESGAAISTNQATLPVHSVAPGPQAQARADLEARLGNGRPDTVREVAHATGKRKRLTNRIKDELKHLTLEYQQKIHELAITHEVRSEILFKWVGGFNKMKGPNRFNNYCRYGREPLQIFARKEFPPGERMQQVAAKWRALTEAEQLKYNDLEFLNKLRQAIGLPGADNPEDIEDEDREEAGEIDAEFIEARVAQNVTQPDQTKSSAVTIQQASKSNSQALSVCTKWIKGVTKQFNHLRADHQVEGFVLIVSSDAAGSVFLRGGTPLGEVYMDILKAKHECWKKFHIWVTGMTVDAELNPMARPIKNLPQRAIELWEAGTPAERKANMRDKLKHLLLKATQGKRSRGWPAKARSILQEFNLDLKIHPDAIGPPGEGTVDLETTLLDQDTGKYSKNQIDAVLKALHFNWISIQTAGNSDSEEDSGVAQGPQGGPV
ncbi:hypothetical protein PGT21_050304 [Puccinia graminis f. sp. tritici]|uniref:Uncharacterized protein n=1 Tax=Puccinia graminis f. sp. tritici TaxID=56615 RepID=A0A5B0MFL2_PUCGR|nr:hypothetical protein PGT21_050304 [Puccinia graminis f. sp. tritici]